MASNTADIITLNVRGTKFTTLRARLQSQSEYFNILLSPRWEDRNEQIDGYLFVDANPRIFECILDFLGTHVPPIFWTRTNGFDYPRYAELRRQAEIFGMNRLADWIAEKKYLSSVMIRYSTKEIPIVCGVVNYDGETHSDNV